MALKVLYCQYTNDTVADEILTLKFILFSIPLKGKVDSEEIPLSVHNN